MLTTRFLTCIAGLAAMTLGCKKNPDPHHIDVAKFESPQQLADTLRYLVGMTEPVVWEAMQRNGFKCGERRGIVITQARTLGSGKPSLDCWYSHRTNWLLRRRVWTVSFDLDSTRVRGVTASFIYQDMG
jgi:hypothetical protein